jgi:hypothetical protein
MSERGSGSGGAGGGGNGGEYRRYAYPQLTSTNYTTWSIRTQAIMEDQGVWEVVNLPEGTSTTLTAEQSGKDKTARAHLL